MFGKIISQKFLYLAFGFSFLFFLSSVGFYAIKKNALEKTLVALVSFETDSSSAPVVLPVIPPAEKVFNVLLLGHGDPSHPGGDLADSLIVVHLDTLQRRVGLVSVPRDTWVSLPEDPDDPGSARPHKINEAFLIGKRIGGDSKGFQVMKQAVSLVTGLPIHHVIAIDFSGLNRLISSLGGVEVDVPHAFDDFFYPVKGLELESCGRTVEDITALSATLSGFQLEKQFPCRYERLSFRVGKTEMDGETALKFVRSRHADVNGGDFARAERQQALLVAIKDKLLSLNGLERAPAFFDRFVKMVKTDLAKEVVVEGVKLIADPQAYQIKKVILSTENVLVSSKSSSGQYILLSKEGENQWAAVRQFITENL